MTRIFKTWTNRIDAGTFSQYQCLQWAKAVVPISEGNESSTSYNGKKTNLTPHEARGLTTLLHARGGVRLTADHTEKAFEWLTKNRAEFPDRAVDLFDHFSFQGDAVDLNDRHACDVPESDYDLDRDGWVCPCGADREESGTWISGLWIRLNAYHVPVWRIHTTDGNILDYCTAPWQATAYDVRRPAQRVRLLEAA